ncbi:MAG: oligosaccharide flippase family protein [Candidatus Neomarinimicrobiota bacterium]
MSIKALGKQSAIYGLGTVLGRLIPFLLLPLYTNVFTPEEFGVMALAYVLIGFVLIIYRYGMDTALMKFYVDADRDEKNKYFTTIFSAQVTTSLLFSALLALSSGILSPILLGTTNKVLMQLVSIILFFDALWMLPLIILRAEEKPVSYITLAVLGVIVQFTLNIVMVVGLKLGVKGVLFANILSSASLLVLTLPIIIKRFRFHYLNNKMLGEILRFGLPFFPAGIFTVIMELTDRLLLEWLTDTATVGIYSAGHKLGMFGSLLVTGFNMGWMPYFLRRGKEPGAKQEFSRITTIFLGSMGFLIVLVSLWIDALVRFEIGGYSFFGMDFWGSTRIVPLILMSYYFLGFYVLQMPGIYLKEKTDWVPFFRLIGATLMVVLCFSMIPVFTILGAAWAKVISYGFMALFVWLKIRKDYSTPYNWIGILFPPLYLILTTLIPDSFESKIIATVCYPMLWLMFILDSESKKQLFRTNQK